MCVHVYEEMKIANVPFHSVIVGEINNRFVVMRRDIKNRHDVPFHYVIVDLKGVKSTTGVLCVHVL